MNSGEAALPGTERVAVQRPITRWDADTSGATALEFALVAMPFFMLLYGIIGVGFYFFTTFTLENALEQAARQLRTGQAQQAGMTAEVFKNLVCSYAPKFVDCQNKILVNVRHYAEADLTPTITRDECLTSNTLTNVSVYSPGAASEIVLVSLCYQWEFAKKLPFLDLTDMTGGRLIQAATVFRTEPYDK